MNIGDVWVDCTKSDGLEKVKYVICVVLIELLSELHNIPVKLDWLRLKFPFNRWENWGAETWTDLLKVLKLTEEPCSVET